MPITIKSSREIELMTEAGRILEIVHNELGKALRPGMSTKAIDKLGEEVIRSYGHFWIITDTRHRYASL